MRERGKSNPLDHDAKEGVVGDSPVQEKQGDNCGADKRRVKHKHKHGRHGRHDIPAVPTSVVSPRETLRARDGAIRRIAIGTRVKGTKVASIDCEFPLMGNPAVIDEVLAGAASHVHVIDIS